MTNSDNRPIRVIYFEDEQVLRDIVYDYFTAVAGFEVVCAVNGKEGLEMMESWKPDFVLTDVRMPVMDGIEVTRFLRSQPDTAGLPIYAITAYSDNKTISECEAAGIDGYFTKPPQYALITSMIKEIVEERWQQEGRV